MALFLTIYLQGGLLILGSATVVWVISLMIKDASIADIFWGSGFVLANWLYFYLSPGEPLLRHWLLNILVTIWGLRLSGYIFWRSRGKPEDYRYGAWREEHGDRWWWRSYLQVFALQGFLLWIISLPLLAVHFSDFPRGLMWLDYFAVLLWGIGFIFEVAGDWQLSAFKSNPQNKGKLLTSGVWRYTRHPNYFGDAAQWWAFYLLAVSNVVWIWTVISPLLMTWLLLRVSGVAMLERNLAQTKPGYEVYIKTTNAFIPWFPKQTG